MVTTTVVLFVLKDFIEEPGMKQDLSGQKFWPGLGAHLIGVFNDHGLISTPQSSLSLPATGWTLLDLPWPYQTTRAQILHLSYV